MLAILGQFVFAVHGDGPFAQTKRQTSQRIAANQRLGEAPAHQYIGPGDDTLSISGMLAPELTRGPSAITLLRDMAAAGESYPLIDGQGNYHGMWIIESITDDRSQFIGNGQARQISFSLELRQDIDWWDADL